MLVTIFAACVLDIVVMLPALAVVEVVPITKLLVPLPVPAPMRLLISAADIPEFSDGTVPLDKTAGTPLSVTFLVLFTISVACAPVIVVVLPALAVDAVVPITKLEVPAPIKDLTSAAEIPEFNEGTLPLLNIAGLPVSDTFKLFAVIALDCAVLIVVVLPAFAFPAPVHTTRFEVPAPIKLLTSAADIPEFKLGILPLDKIAGTPCNEDEVM